MLADPLRDPPADPDAIRRVVEDVLSRPEYARAEPGPLERALDWLLERVAGAFDAVTVTGPGRAIGILLLVVLVGLAAWLLARAFARFRFDRAGSVAVEGPAGRTAQDWLAEAEDHERDGDLAPALRCHYRAVLARLDAAGVVEEVPGTTTGEYRETVVGTLPDAREAFSDLTAAFERAWYGRRPVAPLDLDAAKAAAEEVRRALGQPARAGP